MNENSQEQMEGWYSFAAEQEGFVGFALKTIRESHNISIENQQQAFGADSEGFSRLQAMPMPRGHKYADDAYRIGEACLLLNPMVFVNTMLLVKGVSSFRTKIATQHYYQAAFDVVIGLDDEPKGE